MRFEETSWNKVYKKMPALKALQQYFEEISLSKTLIKASIRWDNWRFSNDFKKEKGDLAISFIDDKTAKIEFAPEVVSLKEAEQIFIMSHEIGHIEKGHLENDFSEEKSLVEEKEADNYSRSFLNYVEKRINQSSKKTN